MGDDVAVGPLPGLGERIEVRGDRAAGQDRSLGRTGGARGVDDDGERLVGRLGRDLATASVEVDVDPPSIGKRRGQLGAGRAEDQARIAVVDDVSEL